MTDTRGRRGRAGLCVTALLCLVALCLAACGSSGATGSGGNSSGPQHGGSITIGQVGDPQSLDPTQTYANQSILIIKNVYEMLYDSTTNGQSFTPWLATGYSLSANKLAWTFYLRKGV